MPDEEVQFENLVAPLEEVDEDQPEFLSPEELEQKLRDERKVMTQRALRHRAELWTTAAAQDDAFKELVAEFRQRQARMKKYFFDQLQMGVAVDQREIDRQRGYLEGLGYLDTLLRAAQNLLEELEERERSEPENDETEIGGWSWPERTNQQ